MALSDVWYGDGIARLSLVRRWYSNVECRGATVLCCQMKHGIGSVKRSDTKLWYGTVWHCGALRRQRTAWQSNGWQRYCIVVPVLSRHSNVKLSIATEWRCPAMSNVATVTLRIVMASYANMENITGALAPVIFFS